MIAPAVLFLFLSISSISRWLGCISAVLCRRWCLCAVGGFYLPPTKPPNIPILPQRRLNLLLANQEPHPPASTTLLLNTHKPSLYKVLGRSFNPSHPRSTPKFLLGNTLRAHNPLRFIQHVPQPAVTFTLLGRQYSILSTVRSVVCVCGCLVLRRAFLIYACNAHMQQLKALEESGKWGEDGDEVTVDKNKPIPFGYKSKGEGWGIKARKTQRKATKRVEEEARRRNLGEEGGLKGVWISVGIGL
ncbi:hypothetical protein L873DRAFT_1889427 [Choiromyces venosus 120613-1]|uniref:Uncharacterized protein n=1 Tax=Choiromyces venosus 120613-1 TaxID=1336337 RepID=A0A3N4JSV0_9PEZI|nr:hypothetical protein L873DRAFT_1889427 [Choiromyces venosus 120613-1]